MTKFSIYSKTWTFFLNLCSVVPRKRKIGQSYLPVERATCLLVLDYQELYEYPSLISNLSCLTSFLSMEISYAWLLTWSWHSRNFSYRQTTCLNKTLSMPALRLDSLSVEDLLSNPYTAVACFKGEMTSKQSSLNVSSLSYFGYPQNKFEYKK